MRSRHYNDAPTYYGEDSKMIRRRLQKFYEKQSLAIINQRDVWFETVKKPFRLADLDKAVLYGILAEVIGHESTHSRRDFSCLLPKQFVDSYILLSRFEDQIDVWIDYLKDHPHFTIEEKNALIQILIEVKAESLAYSNI